MFIAAYGKCEAVNLLTVLDATPFTAQIDAGLQLVRICEDKEPDHAPGKALETPPYRGKGAPTITIIWFVFIISRSNHFVSSLLMRVLIGGGCLRDRSARAIEDQPDHSFKRPADQGVHYHGNHR